MTIELPKPIAVTPVPNVRYREFTKCGQKPLAGGQIWTYEANSTTPKITYQDPYGMTPNTNPIILDAAGEADVYLNGTYRFVVKDKNGFIQKDVSKIGSWYSGDLDDQMKSVNDLLESSAQTLMQPLQDAIDVALAAGAGGAGWVSDLVADGDENQKQINDISVRSFETIAELIAYTPRRNGQVVNVKGFYKPTNLALKEPYKGGDLFVFNLSRHSENDGVSVFNGWERQFKSDVFTPYMSGCVCDGLTDDTLNLDKLMYFLEKNKRTGTVIFEDEMFFNNQCPLTGKLTYAMNFGDGLPVIRLVDNVALDIRTTLKFGSFYNDKSVAFFNAKYNRDSTDWMGFQHFNIKISGGGILDFTGAGTMQTEYRKRIAISGASTVGLEVSNLTFKGGDFMNTIVTNYNGKTTRIFGNTFIDQMSDSSKSHDHSTMYLIAEDALVYDNDFISNGIKTQINACAVELHGNNQHFYNNKTIQGYRNAVFVAAYKLGHEGVNDTYRGDISIYGNDATCVTFFKLWTDAVLPIEKIQCYKNNQKLQKFISRSEIISSGVDVSLYDNLPLVGHFFGTETDQNAKQIPNSPNCHIEILDNSYDGGDDQYPVDYFIHTPLIVKDGLDIQRNKIRARQLFVLDDFRNYGQEMIVRNFKFKNNDIDWSAIFDRLPITTSPIGFQGCEILINVDYRYSPSSEIARSTSPFYIDVKPNETFNNRFEVLSERYDRFDKWISGSLLSQERSFYSYNSITYDLLFNLSVYVPSGSNSAILYSTSDSICSGVSKIQAHSYSYDGTIEVLLPPSFSKDMRNGAVHRQVSALAYIAGTIPSNQTKCFGRLSTI